MLQQNSVALQEEWHDVTAEVLIKRKKFVAKIGIINKGILLYPSGITVVTRLAS